MPSKHPSTTQRTGQASGVTTQIEEGIVITGTVTETVIGKITIDGTIEETIRNGTIRNGAIEGTVTDGAIRRIEAATTIAGREAVIRISIETMSSEYDWIYSTMCVCHQVSMVIVGPHPEMLTWLLARTPLLLM